MHEPAIEVGDQVGRAPVQLRRNCGHECGQKSRNRNSAILVREMRVQHHHVTGLRMLQSGVQDDDRESGDNPRPRTDGIMRDVEPQDREQPLLLITGAEDALRNVAAAARLRARIPERPPLQPDEHQEAGHRNHPQRLRREASRKFGKEAEGIGSICASGGLHLAQAFEHGRHAAARNDCEIRDRNDDRHLQHKLKQVRP